MLNIRLCKMTKSLCRQFYNGFTNDPDIFMDLSRFVTYVYSPERADTYWQRHQDLGRIHLAMMLDDEPIGEVVLKNIDLTKRCCTMGIHMKNDSVKNRGYGTAGEILVLLYAFNELQMEKVYADAILKNTRSQHVLKKVGFIETHKDEQFIYYRCDKYGWTPPSL